MRATNTTSQWLFPLSDIIHQTPSRTTSNTPVEQELYDRARGVEVLFRMGVSLALPISAMYTAATWFHRFYMRYAMEDYHRQDVASACIFLATKTEECGRKLRDVAKVFCAKLWRKKVEDIADNDSLVESTSVKILAVEELLLEALCFDFVVGTPHAELVDLFDAHQERPEVEEYAWSIASDSCRTILSIMFPPQIIAAACYILAQQYAEGPGSLSLAARVASPAPSASLPTPPSNRSPFSESARFAIDFFQFNETELASVAEALSILIEFYAAQELETAFDYLAQVARIPPPPTTSNRIRLYYPFEEFTQAVRARHLEMIGAMKPAEKGDPLPEKPLPDSEASSSSNTTAKGWKPVKGEDTPGKSLLQRLDLS